MIRVVAPGPFTTVQDLGRPGWGSYGVPPSGAMDTLALRAANLLAGNAEDAAGLEITMAGPALVFEASAVVALAGAAIEAAVDGIPVVPGESIGVEAGQRLDLGKMTSGARTYLAVRGGIDVPALLGSRSTLAAAGIGGLRGRKLAEADFIRVGATAGAPLGAPPRRRLGDAALPAPTEVVRAIAGPQDDAFTNAGFASFWGSAYSVDPRSDRIGVRLSGEAIEHARGADLDPEGVVAGAVQVPGDGRPIVLGPDRPTTGGYAKIATVITADLSLIAQARPGDTLRFVSVSIEEARAAWAERERALADGIEDLQ
jgi:antagonist of KipI